MDLDSISMIQFRLLQCVLKLSASWLLQNAHHPFVYRPLYSIDDESPYTADA